MRTLILVFFLSVLFLSCKKKTQNTKEVDIISDSPHTASTAKSFSGMFTSDSYTIVQTKANIISGNNAQVFFSKEPVSGYDPSKVLPVGGVTLNEVALNFENSNSFYLSSSPHDLSKEIWQVSGSNEIPSFKYTSESNDPKWSGFSSIPDTIRLSAEFSFTLTGLSNMTRASMVLTGADNIPQSVQVYRELKKGDNFIVFTTTDLSVLMPSPNEGFVQIYAENTFALNFYGKDFQFKKCRAFSKYIIFAP